MQWKRMIPNAFTLGNLLCGVLGIVFLLGRGELELACLAVFAGAFLDLFDGLAARLLKVESEVGKQLDSLADVVTFGVLPGVIAMTFIPITIENQMPAAWMDQRHYLSLIGLVIPMAAAYRLAVFNVDQTQSSSFKGLPTPANALLWASIPLAMMVSSAWQFFGFRVEAGQGQGANIDVRNLDLDKMDGHWTLRDVEHWAQTEGGKFPVEFDSWMFLFSSNAFYIVLTLVTAALMISRIPMFSLKFKKGSNNRPVWLFLGISLVIFLGIVIPFKNPFAPIPIIILLYLLISIGSHLISRRNAVQSRD